MPRSRTVTSAAGLILAACVLPAWSPAPPARTPGDAIDAGFQAFWSAGNRRDAAKAADRLIGGRVEFDVAWRRLKQGRAYGKAPAGPRPQTLRVGDQTFENTIDIPEQYDPARPWPVRVQLHGGINRPEPQESPRRRQNRLAGEPQIYILPVGWGDAAWWHANQVDNILELVDRVKRTYNVDESHVYLTGTSDGGTGAYYLAMREPTPWSAYLPLIGNLRVLASPDARADGDLFVGNLVNRPFFIVNSEHDPLYPVAQIEPYIDLMRRAGVSLVFHPQPDAGHDTSWWPSERPAFETFVHDHPRNPYRDRLSWETERTDRYNRIDWLVIDALGTTSGAAALEDVNTYSPRGDADFGARSEPRVDDGTRLTDVVDGSDAYELGLRKGDLIVAVDGRAVADGQAIVRAMTDHRLGTPIEIVVERKGRRQTLAGKFPPEPVAAPPRKMFDHHRASGRVDLVRRGNTVEARTRGVRAFTLLLSPDVFDFAAPVAVTVNSRAAFQGVVKKDPAVLLKWAARDNDRTMLFGAELKIEVSK